MASNWKYTGDKNIECGGMFYNDEGPDSMPDYIEVVIVTPASDGGGVDNVFYVERGSIYMPNDDLKRMRNTADICGWTLDEGKNLRVPSYSGESDTVLEFQSPEWRARMLDAWLAYHGIDGPDSWVVRVGPRDKDTDDSGWLSQHEPDFKLRSNVNLKRWIENEFCN
jgi:hypothetical protein